MIDQQRLLAALRPVVVLLVDDLRERSEDPDAAVTLSEEFRQARDAGRTDQTYETWREDRLHEVAAAWVLAAVFVRFCEDNRLTEPPLLSGPGERRQIAREYRQQFFSQHVTAGDRAWLEHVFARYRSQHGTRELFGDRSAISKLSPSDDGARALLEVLWQLDDDSGQLALDFTDRDWDTRFLGDLYQDLSERARKKYALLQTPRFVESFILDYTLDPAIKEFGVAEVRMIDPTCGSGHFLLGAFDRLLEAWRQREPATPPAVLAERVLTQVNGVDANPFAVAIARFRLLIAALKTSGETRLADAPDFRFRVATADSLIHGTRPGLFLDASEVQEPLQRFRYSYEDDELAHKLLRHGQYDVVVGNPPYITVKDPGLNTAYRTLYQSCHRQYSLAVPFTERFFDLACHRTERSGYVGMITANSFMKREFGKKLIEQHLPRYDLTHVIDTSGAYIPGHGTPTVILFGRNQRPASAQVRAVLGIRGEPGRPEDPARGEVWSSIVDLVDKPGSENDYISVLDLQRDGFARHPWSLQGGAAPDTHSIIEQSSTTRIERLIDAIGFGGITGEDNVYAFLSVSTARRLGIEDARPLVIGEDLRDWVEPHSEPALWPYDEHFMLLPISQLPSTRRFAWPYRKNLSRRKHFGTPMEELGEPWYAWRELYHERLRTRLSITFAFVATHNHFVLDRGGKVFNRSAPVIKLPEGASEDEHLELLGLLNSSTACFWMKQVFHVKGKMSSGTGGVVDEPWEPFWEFDGTKLKQFPIPGSTPLLRTRRLDALAQEMSGMLPDAVCAEQAPTPELLDAARAEVERLRSRMVALQEELDWECYRLYGLLDEDLTLPEEQLPEIALGQRAFEIVLARQVARGQTSTTWFERHGSTPITELPSHWPDGYRQLVEQRIARLESDRKLGLLERPEYKRRWNWEAWEDLEQQALREWLLDRLEAREHWSAPRVRTVAQLTDLVRHEPEFVVAAERYTGRRDVDLSELVGALVDGDEVPYLAAWRYTDAGLRKRAQWEHVWELQRQEDAIDARTELPADDPERLTPEQAAKEKDELDIPVPPKYAKGDFRSGVTWTLRGKLDVPKERFVAYPGTQVGSDASAVIGWAGWNHLEQAQALAGHYNLRRDAGAEPVELTALLAGLAELEPWLLQWHNEVDATYGQRLGDFFRAFIDGETRRLGVTREDLAAWRPPARRNRRRRNG